MNRVYRTVFLILYIQFILSKPVPI